MGVRYDFICQQCEYTALVSGGRDVGMLVTVETMSCADCRKLVDVVIEERGQPPVAHPDTDTGVRRCPDCAGAAVVAWEDSQPCPRCGGRMAKGNLIEMWD